MPTADTTIASLRLNPRNPRRVTDVKLAMLKKAMKRFGDLGGVVLNTTSGHLVGGHQRTKVIPANAKVHVTQRYLAPTEAGTTAEGHITWGDERFAYREVAWPEDVEKAANLAANKGAGEFDIAAVADWIGELDTGDFDMDLTMFDADELANLMAPKGTAQGDAAWDDALDGVPAGDKPGYKTITFTLSDKQHDLLMERLADMKSMGPFVSTGNENTNGNALARLCEMHRG